MIFLSPQTRTKGLLIVVGFVLFTTFIFFGRFDNGTSGLIDYQKQAGVIFQICSQSESKKNCYNHEFGALTAKEGFSPAIQVLRVLQSLDPITQQCHGLAHIISVTAVHRDPESWKTLARDTNVGMDMCAGGFLHGVLEGHMAANPDFVIGPDFILDVCSQQNSVSATACAHGFGHVALFQTKGDVPAAALICSGTNSLDLSCFNGLFMEDAFRTLLFEHGIVSEVKDPTKDTKRLQEVGDQCLVFKNNPTASQACWANLGHIFADFYHHDEQN